MPDNGSGVYTAPAGTKGTANATIESDKQNTWVDDVVAALTNRVAKDGQSTMTGNLKMGSNKVTGLAAGTADTDAVRMDQLDPLEAADVVLTKAAKAVIAPILSNNGSDAAHDIDIAAGRVWDATGTSLMDLSALTKRLDGTFVEGTNAGGMVSGESLPASGTVHVWMIEKADGTTDVCANNHADTGLSPTLPTGFVYKRRIGSLVTDASNNIRSFIQTGNYFELGFIPTTETIGTTVATVTLPVPSGIRVLVSTSVMVIKTGSAAIGTVVGGDAGDPTVVSPVTTGTSAAYFAPSAGIGDGGIMQVLTNTSGEVKAKAHVAGTAFYFSTRGYTDPGLFA